VQWETPVAKSALLSIDSLHIDQQRGPSRSFSSDASADAPSAGNGALLLTAGQGVCTADSGEAFVIASSMDGRVHLLDLRSGDLLASAQVAPCTVTHSNQLPPPSRPEACCG
jgi:hypothetical protein